VPALRRDGTELDLALTLAAARVEPDQEMIIGTLRELPDRVGLERKLRAGRYMRAAAAAAAQLASVPDVDRILGVAVETLVEQFDAALARIWLKEPQAKLLRLRASAGLSRRIEGSPRQYVDIASHPYKLGLVARTRQPFTRNDLAGDLQFDQEWVKREGIASAAVFPLLVASDLQGVLVAFFRQTLDEEGFEALAMLAAMVATAVNGAQRCDRAQRARDEVLAVVSHDLRAPLNMIEMGAISLLRKGGGDDSTEAVLRIKRAAERMGALIRDLLDISALETGRLRMGSVKQVLGPLVSEAIEQMRPFADEKRIRLSAKVAVPNAEVWCDRARIIQVFSNLLGNAIKFTDEGGAVTVHVVEDDRRVTFAVTDTGCGIAEDKLPHVFDRDWKGRGVESGVGLGLAIAKGIVEGHHGAIRAESTLGKGSTFAFDLPRTV
jgi:signal transduction histidine kinase